MGGNALAGLLGSASQRGPTYSAGLTAQLSEEPSAGKIFGLRAESGPVRLQTRDRRLCVHCARGATSAGAPGRANEDWWHVDSSMAIVLDGATARTETGCCHGVAWYAHHLGAALARWAGTASTLIDALKSAITDVTDKHPRCDLAHPDAPSAAVGVVRWAGDVVEWLGLGDVTIIAGGTESLHVVDDRVSTTAADARARADRLPIGSPEKAQALLEMKSGELAARNTSDGYWIAATDPDAADHALTGHVDANAVDTLALLSDGATRAIEFGLTTPQELLADMRRHGPEQLITRGRAAEATDPLGERWPRSKASDDATAVVLHKGS